jgi:hypothetical protein
MHNALISMFAYMDMSDLILVMLSIAALYGGLYMTVRVGSTVLYMVKERRYLASEGATFQGKSAVVSVRPHAEFSGKGENRFGV